MKVIRSYIKGWTSLFQYKRMWLIMYGTNFLLALFAAIPVSGFLGRSVGYSMSLGRSHEGFDYTFIGEMYRRFKHQIDAILDQTVLTMLVFFIVSIFLVGGVLHIYKKEIERFSLKTFWRGCSKYFWRFFRLTVYFLAIHGLILFVFFVLFSANTGGLSPFLMESEKELMDTFMWLAPFYVLVFTFVSMIQDYAKIHIVHENPALLFKPIWESIKLVFKNIGKFALLYLLNIITFLAIFGIYWLISDQFDEKTISSIMLLFIVGQLFMIARVGVKLLNLSSATHLYKIRNH